MLSFGECIESVNNVIVQNGIKEDFEYILKLTENLNGEQFVKFVSQLFSKHFAQLNDNNITMEQQYKIFIDNGIYQLFMLSSDYRFDVHFFDNTFYRVLFEDCSDSVEYFINWLLFDYEDNTLNSLYDTDWISLLELQF